MRATQLLGCGCGRGGGGGVSPSSGRPCEARRVRVLGPPPAVSVSASSARCSAFLPLTFLLLLLLVFFPGASTNSSARRLLHSSSSSSSHRRRPLRTQTQTPPRPSAGPTSAARRRPRRHVARTSPAALRRHFRPAPGTAPLKPSQDKPRPPRGGSDVSHDAASCACHAPSSFPAVSSLSAASASGPSFLSHAHAPGAGSVCQVTPQLPLLRLPQPIASLLSSDHAPVRHFWPSPGRAPLQSSQATPTLQDGFSRAEGGLCIT